MGKNFLISPDLISNISDDFDYNHFFENVAPNLDIQSESLMLDINKFNEIVSLQSKSSCDIVNIQTSVNIIKSYNEEPIKREIQHFVEHFRNRYAAMIKILQGRIELSNIISIRRVNEKKESEKAAVIGLVTEKRITKNGHIILVLEDPTGVINILINKDKADLMKEMEDVVMDEMIGIVGNTGENIVFANEVYFPDIPMGKEYKKSPDEVYAAFISDIHVGSNMFLEKELLKFISWLNCEGGNEEQKNVANKLKYLFIIGDLVDGVGIYPGQEEELVIKDIHEQYNKCAEYFSKIRKDIHIIICAGNHDAVRIAEPQPNLDEKYAKAIYQLPNVTIVSNPSLINIHKTDNFPGFDVLMYHGYCFDYYIANVDNIRNNGGYDRTDLVMSLLLKKRHLSPAHASTLYIPDLKNDPLVIDKIPDFFISGHTHKTSVSSYKNVTTICGSCWQAKTSFQEKVGHNPEPCRVPIVNLKTRQLKILRFDTPENE